MTSKGLKNHPGPCDQFMTTQATHCSEYLQMRPVEPSAPGARSGPLPPPKVRRITELPPEIVLSIVAYLPHAHSVSHLSQSCKYLHAIIQDSGWRDFVRTRFPSQGALHNGHGDAARTLTTLSRNWDRKALTARYIEPSFPTYSLNTKERLDRWPRPQGQTMGFQPCLDSYGLMHHEDLNRRQEYLAASAGAQLLLRKTSIGPVVERWWEQCSPEDRRLYWDNYHHRTAWYNFKFPGSTEGRDDITSLNLLRPPSQGYLDPERQDIVVGSAQGTLSLLHVCLGETPSGIKSSWDLYDTKLPKGNSVRATAVSASASPLLAAAFDDCSIRLYPVHSPHRSFGEPLGQNPTSLTIDPLDHLVLPLDAKCRAWNTHFVSSSTLATGVGPSAEPVHVYAVTATGFSQQPVRKFTLPRSANEDIATNGRTSSVYSLASLSPSSQASNDTGQVFLSGAYDGVVRVHDMRSPKDSESHYWDPTDDGAVYSMQLLARERLVVGNSRNALVKVYDLRMASGRAYHYFDLDAHVRARAQRPSKHDMSVNGDDLDRDPASHTGWNLFLSPRNPARGPHPQRRHNHNHRASTSPVYALTAPSPHSPSLVAGVENGFLQLDATSTTDVHADPIYQHAMTRRAAGGTEASIWNPRGEVLNLAAYEQGSEDAMRLRVQGDVSAVRGARGVVPGWDARWRDSRDG